MAERWLGGFTGKRREVISLVISNLIIQSTFRLRNKSRTAQPREHEKFQLGGIGGGGGGSHVALSPLNFVVGF